MGIIIVDDKDDTHNQYKKTLEELKEPIIRNKTGTSGA